MSRELDRKPNKSQSEQQSSRKINYPRQFKDERTQTDRQESKRMADRLSRGAMALRVDDRKHLEARLRIFIAVNPCNRQKMRQLPECQDRKQRPAFTRQLASGSRPAHQRWQCTRYR